MHIKSSFFLVLPRHLKYVPMSLEDYSICDNKLLKTYVPVKSASKKLAPNNLAPLKFACLNIDCNKINTQRFKIFECKSIKRFAYNKFDRFWTVLKSCLIKVLPLKSLSVSNFNQDLIQGNFLICSYLIRFVLGNSTINKSLETAKT